MSKDKQVCDGCNERHSPLRQVAAGRWLCLPCHSARPLVEEVCRGCGETKVPHVACPICTTV